MNLSSRSGLKGPEVPRVIFLAGVDGSGKSFFAEQVVSELRERGVAVERLWSRFNNITSKPLLALCRLTGLNYYERTDGVLVGYHDFEKSRLISRCFILCQIIDLWLVTLVKVWPRLLAGKTLVCDRGAYDTLVDVMVDTKDGSLCNGRIGRLFTLLLPRNHRVFFLFRDPLLIVGNRPDVAADRNFDLRRTLYAECARHFGWSVVDNNGSAAATLQQILSGVAKT